MWNHWQIRVGISLVSGLLLPLGLLLILFAAFTGFMGSTQPWWAYIVTGVGLSILIVCLSIIPLNLNRNLGWGLSVVWGIISLGVIALAFQIWDTGRLNVLLPICFTCDTTIEFSFPLLAMTAFLIASSGYVRGLRTIMALILALSIAFAITLSSERATNGIAIDGQSLSLVFVWFLFPSLAFSLSTLLNISIREKLPWRTILLSLGMVTIITLVLSLVLGRIFASVL